MARQPQTHLPSDILLPGVAHVRPERVGASLCGVELTIGVAESRLQQLSEIASLLLREPGCSRVGFGVGQV